MCIPQTSRGKLSDFTLPVIHSLSKTICRKVEVVIPSPSARVAEFLVLSSVVRGQGPLPELLLDAMVEQLWVGGPKSKDLDQIPMDSVKLGER